MSSWQPPYPRAKPQVAFGIASRQSVRSFVSTRSSRTRRVVSCTAGSTNQRLQIVFVSTEVAPWSKVGGLGDVMATLPVALAARGHKVMAIAPRYANYVDVRDTGVRAPVQLPCAAPASTPHTPAAASGSLPSSTPAAAVQPTPAAGQVVAATAATGDDVPGPATASPSPLVVAAALAALEGAAAAAVVSTGTAQGLPGTSAVGSKHSSSSSNSSSGGRAGSSGVLPLPAAGGSAAPPVAYYMTCRHGVDWVFVDHPLYCPAPHDDRSPGRVYTYRHAEGGAWHDLAACYSVLAQAALAAPFLLWPSSSGSSDGAGGHGPSGQQDVLSPAAVSVMEQLQYPRQLVHGLVVPVFEAAGEMTQLLEAHKLQAELLEARKLQTELQQQLQQQKQQQQQQQQQQEQHPDLPRQATQTQEYETTTQPNTTNNGSSTQQHSADGSHPLVFVGADWPCGVLPLWLHTYLSAAAQEEAAAQAAVAASQATAAQPLPQLHPHDTTSWQLAAAAAMAAAARSVEPATPPPQGGDSGAAMAEAVEEVQAGADLPQGASPAHGGEAGEGGGLEAGAPPYVLATLAEAQAQLVQLVLREQQRRAAATQGQGGEQEEGSEAMQAVGARPEEALAAALHGAIADAAPGSQPYTSAATSSSLLGPGQAGEQQQTQRQEQQQQQRPKRKKKKRWKGPQAQVEGEGSEAAGARALPDLPSAGTQQAYLDTLPQEQQQQVGINHGGLPALHLPVERTEQDKEHAADAAPSPKALSRQRDLLLRQRESALQQQADLAAQLDAKAATEAALASSNGSGNVSSADEAGGVRREAPGGSAEEAAGPAQDSAPAAQEGSHLSQPRQQQQAPIGPAAEGASPVASSSASSALSHWQAQLGAALSGAKVVFTIHNGSYQGLFPGGPAAGQQLGLAPHTAAALAPPAAPGAAGAGAASSWARVVGSTAATLRAWAAHWPWAAQQLQQQQAAEAGEGPSSTSNSTTAAATAPQGSDAAGGTGGGSGGAMLAAAGSPNPLLGEGAGIEAAAGSAAPPPAAAAAPAGPSPAQLNWLRGGVAASDAVLTVSPHYAAELLNTQQLPRDVVATLRRKGLRGILNGLNATEWDPASDPQLPAATRYSAATVASGKAAAKRLLQQRLGLVVAPGVPLVAYLGRLEEHKGVDVLLAALPELLGPAQGGPGSSSSSSTAGVAQWGPVRTSRPPQHQQQEQGKHQHQHPAGPRQPSSTGTAADSSSTPPQAAAGGTGAAGAQVVGGGSTADVPLGAAAPGATQQVEHQGTATSDASAAPNLAASEKVAAAQPPLQLLVLGRGQAWMEEVVGGLSSRYPGAAVGVPSFNEPLAHLLLAAADFLVVPSRSEPCGLVALAALRYGTLPIAAATGGLVDIVRPGEAGLLFEAPGDSWDAYAMRRGISSLVGAVQQALGVYGTPEFQRQREAAMGRVVGWQRAAEAWEAELVALVAPPAAPSTDAAAGDGGSGEVLVAAGGSAGAGRHAA